MEFNISQLKWTRKPQSYDIKEDKIEMITKPYTDLWQRTISRLRIQLYLAGRSNCICKLRYLENEDTIDQWIGREIGAVNDSV